MVDVSLWTLLLIPLLVITSIYVISLFIIERPPPLSLPGSHAFITGGSSGVGLSTALCLLPLGVHCTIIGRDPKRLKDAESYLREATAKTRAGYFTVKILAIPCDVCDLSQTTAAIKRAEAEMGPITIFIHSAGASSPGYFEKLPPSVHTAQFNLNYLGAINCLYTLVPGLKARGSSRVVLVASMGALSGIFGFTAYSASKFALRGFAESLHMEMAPYGCYVSVVCPPDMDTPGFAEENRTKPIECSEISGKFGLFPPSVIGKEIVGILKKWKFLSSVGFDGNALMILGTGTSPAWSAGVLTLEVLTMGVLRIVSVVYRMQYNRIVERIKRQREKGRVQPGTDPNSRYH